MCFHKFEKFSATAFQIASLSFCLFSLTVYFFQTVPLDCLLFFNLFSFFSLDSIIFIVLSSSWLTLSSSCSNLPLNPYSEFFISVIVFYSSRIFFFGSFLSFLSIDISVLFTHHFLDFITFSFSSLSIFKTIVLKSLCSMSAIISFSEIVSIDFFFPLSHPYLLFLCMPCHFLWTLDIWIN